MAIALSLMAAVTFGTGDFFGGMSAKRVSVLYVVGFSHLVGLVGVGLIAPIMAERFIATDLALGAAAGLVGAVGVMLLYRGLARGPMAVVAPITAITSAAVPSAWAVMSGDRLSGWVAGGIVLALVAIGLISRPSSTSATPVSIAVVAEALAAGTGFGAMFILFDATSDAGAPWPVVGARLLTATLIVGFIVARKRPTRSELAPALPFIVLTGLFDTGSNILFLMATGRGQLTIVAVLSSLYPAATVLLARLVLGERMSPTQIGGFGAALAATALIAAG